MKLYEVPKNTNIIWNNQPYYFLRIDGMYSLCLDQNNNPIHIAAYADVELVDVELGDDHGTERHTRHACNGRNMHGHNPWPDSNTDR